MNVLIFGGTRFLGKEIVSKLNQKNLNITVFSRRPSFEGSVSYISGDRNKIADIKKIEGRFDIIIDFISYNAINTSNILKLFPNARYILISSAWKKNKFSKICQAKLSYIENKRLAELEVIKSKKNNKTNTIIRLPIILGENDHTKRTNFFRQNQFSENKIVFLTEPDIKISFCWKSDVSSFIAKEILSESKCVSTYMYPQKYFNITLNSYINMHQHLENKKYTIFKIHLNEMSDSKIFNNYLNNIGNDFYFPIQIFGKPYMEIDKVDRLYSLMKKLSDVEPLHK